MDYNKLRKILKRMGVADPLTCLLKACMEVKNWQLESDTEQLKYLKLGKEQGKVHIFTLLIDLVCRKDHLIYAGLHKSHDGIKIAGKISTSTDVKMTPP